MPTLRHPHVEVEKSKTETILLARMFAAKSWAYD
jgi:hypothetical protein